MNRYSVSPGRIRLIETQRQNQQLTSNIINSLKNIIKHSPADFLEDLRLLKSMNPNINQLFKPSNELGYYLHGEEYRYARMKAIAENIINSAADSANVEINRERSLLFANSSRESRFFPKNEQKPLLDLAEKPAGEKVEQPVSESLSASIPNIEEAQEIEEMSYRQELATQRKIADSLEIQENIIQQRLKTRHDNWHNKHKESLIQLNNDISLPESVILSKEGEDFFDLSLSKESNDSFDLSWLDKSEDESEKISSNSNANQSVLSNGSSESEYADLFDLALDIDWLEIVNEVKHLKKDLANSTYSSENEKKVVRDIPHLDELNKYSEISKEVSVSLRKILTSLQKLKLIAINRQVKSAKNSYNLILKAVQKKNPELANKLVLELEYHACGYKLYLDDKVLNQKSLTALNYSRQKFFKNLRLNHISYKDSEALAGKPKSEDVINYFKMHTGLTAEQLNHGNQATVLNKIKKQIPICEVIRDVYLSSSTLPAANSITL